jgi:hypothetical protein
LERANLTYCPGDLAQQEDNERGAQRATNHLDAQIWKRFARWQSAQAGKRQRHGRIDERAGDTANNHEDSKERESLCEREEEETGASLRLARCGLEHTAGSGEACMEEDQQRGTKQFTNQPPWERKRRMGCGWLAMLLFTAIVRLVVIGRFGHEHDAFFCQLSTDQRLPRRFMARLGDNAAG